MIEWLQSIGTWLSENKDGIVIAFTTFATSGTAANLWQFFKNRKIVSENTGTTKSLTEALKENSVLKDKVDEAKELLNIAQSKIQALEDKIVDTVNGVDTVITKVNAMLDVQSLVYQTIRDESTRTAVQNILTNAKYAATEQRAQLIKQLTELKEANARQTAENQARVDEAVNKAVSLVEASRTETNTVIRG